MSGTEVVGFLLDALSTRKATAHRTSYKERLSEVTRSCREQRFGWFVRLLSWLSWFIAFDTDAVQELQKNINTWTDDEILAWKTSYIDSCNAIAVAVRLCNSCA